MHSTAVRVLGQRGGRLFGRRLKGERLRSSVGSSDHGAGSSTVFSSSSVWPLHQRPTGCSGDLGLLERHSTVGSSWVLERPARFARCSATLRIVRVVLSDGASCDGFRRGCGPSVRGPPSPPGRSGPWVG